MSPVDDMHVRGVNRFPRVSGDEPTYQITINGVLEFSPRERG